ncbi:hypothetical protein L6452_12050 [Arctium lappa]|uniref:Uncharacterized protein n=1 Tax=Arctium lappa TaxID=4217 RepID=A0ACB9DQJ6_ARCLA|nr:hypothetical protein L6452_12050 [Arctium lappa]
MYKDMRDRFKKDWLCLPHFLWLTLSLSLSTSLSFHSRVFVQIDGHGWAMEGGLWGIEFKRLKIQRICDCSIRSEVS